MTLLTGSLLPLYVCSASPTSLSHARAVWSELLLYRILLITYITSARHVTQHYNILPGFAAK